jgi:hypothetical protein
MAKFKLRTPFTSRNVADAFINEWIDAVRTNRAADAANIEAVIKPMLDDDGGKRQVKVLLDPPPDANGMRTIFLIGPQPEPASGQSIEDWIKKKWGDDSALSDFGNAILAGCGK